MRFSPDSVSGQRLQALGVGADEIAATRFIVWNRQSGAAITLPVPILGITVFIKQNHLKLDDDGELADDREIRFPVHELCHARQVLDWGVMRYWWRQIKARIRSRSFLAVNEPEEVPCYQRQREAEAHYQDG